MPNVVDFQKVTLSSGQNDNHVIPIYSWSPSGKAKAIIQILHGLGEHALRYHQVAKKFTENGYSVIIHNQRGHGETISPSDLGHFSDTLGWEKLISDCRAVQKYSLEQSPQIPLILLGHSMGSYIAQSFVMRHPKDTNVLILSASTWPQKKKLKLITILAKFEIWRRGIRTKSALLNKLGFSDFNKSFSPNRTDFDWLSRDEQIVDDYMADPLCGFQSSNQLWLDLINGLIEISHKDSLKKIPSSLPILITGGELDPVGGSAGLKKLTANYQQTNHNQVTLKIYSQARHEILNEINKAEVMKNILSWISKYI